MEKITYDELMQKYLMLAKVVENITKLKVEDTPIKYTSNGINPYVYMFAQSQSLAARAYIDLIYKGVD